MDLDETCRHLVAELRRVVDAVGAAEPDAPVPSCPGWDVAKLARHLGIIHRWATAMVERRSTERIAPETLDVDLPVDGSWAPWLAEGGRRMVEVFSAADVSRPAWAWGADQHIAFWPRRQLHETAVHRADVELALGRTPTLDPVVAADNIDELLENLPSAAAFSPWVADLRGEGSIHLHATDDGLGEAGEWMIELTPTGFGWHHGHGKGTVACRGAASDLAMLMNRRAGLDERYEVFGDRTLLELWIDHSAIG